MIPNDAFSSLVRILNKSNVPHMVTGSVASTYHGISRATLDVDMVIDPSLDQLGLFTALLSGNGFYVSEQNASAALRSRTQFNVIHMESVWKIDLIIRKDRSFSESEFRRRQQATILGADTFVASAEDLILAKLEWSKDSSSDQQMRDVEGIIEIKGGDLDKAYMEKWARELGVYDTWGSLNWDC